MLQESLGDAFRHTGEVARRVRVTMVQGEIHLEVLDYGLGMPESEYGGVGPQLGLEVMRERVELLGGEIGICRIEPTGTMVKARFPFVE